MLSRRSTVETPAWLSNHLVFAGIMGAALQRMISSFYTRQLEVVLVGLENSGKTTLMNGELSSFALYRTSSDVLLICCTNVLILILLL